MKRYNEEGIHLLQNFKIKDNTEELRKDIYDINDILYKHMYRYTLPNTSYRLYFILIEYGKKIKAYNFNKQTLKDKQQEVLNQLHDICILLKKLAGHNYINSEYYYAYEQIQKYQVSSYLKKKDILTDEDVVKLLQDNKDIATDIANKDNLTKPFIDMQKELLERLNSKYEF